MWVVGISSEAVFFFIISQNKKVQKTWNKYYVFYGDGDDYKEVYVIKMKPRNQISSNDKTRRGEQYFWPPVVGSVTQKES